MNISLTLLLICLSPKSRFLTEFSLIWFFFEKLKSVQGGKLTHCENVKIDWGLEQVRGDLK